MDVRDISLVVYLCIIRCFSLSIIRHPLLRPAHRLIRPGCISRASWGPFGICPPDPEPVASAFCSVWCLFYGLAQGLSSDPQISEQPDGGCCNKTSAANLNRANYCFASNAMSAFSAAVSSHSLHQHHPPKQLANVHHVGFTPTDHSWSVEEALSSLFPLMDKCCPLNCGVLDGTALMAVIFVSIVKNYQQMMILFDSRRAILRQQC